MTGLKDCQDRLVHLQTSFILLICDLVIVDLLICGAEEFAAVSDDYAQRRPE